MYVYLFVSSKMTKKKRKKKQKNLKIHILWNNLFILSDIVDEIIQNYDINHDICSTGYEPGAMIWNSIKLSTKKNEGYLRKFYI